VDTTWKMINLNAKICSITPHIRNNNPHVTTMNRTIKNQEEKSTMERLGEIRHF
jgi:hypothetical protein